MDRKTFDLYIDYLIASTSYTTATGLSRVLNNDISHDKITRCLSEEMLTSNDLWRIVKPLARKIESPDGVLIIDDTIEHKPHTDENELVTWHYDHTQGCSVKGIQLISVLYGVKDVALPVAFDTVKKTEKVCIKTGEVRKQSPLTRNERYRQLLQVCYGNRIPFRYVLNDAWYSAADNMNFVKHELKKDFIMPIKSNRNIALSEQDKRRGSYVKLHALALAAGCPMTIYIEGISFPMLLLKQVFKNEDGTSGNLYLVSSDMELSCEQMITIYQKRWRVEEYHKSLKSNLCLAKSPTRTVVTQTNHIVAALCAFVKLESLKMHTSMNHFALKSKIYLKAIQSAYRELQNITSDKLSYA